MNVMAEKDEQEQQGREIAPAVAAVEPVEVPQVMGATFAERAAAREKADKKAVQSAENKSVDSGETKSKRSTRKG